MLQPTAVGATAGLATEAVVYAWARLQKRSEN
jgi:hypothetical protein